VFLPAWEEGIFPNERTIGEGALEEERRLAYVAITRARRVCVISNAMSRMLFGSRQYNSPSRFITEIDNRYLDFQGGAPRARTYYNSYSAPVKPRPAPITNNTLKGKFVSHDELGSGVVIEDDGNILTVAFKNKGIKKVARQFVTVG
ncbi:MAG: DNA helicase II, partial [Alphaproteobacteria bacterium]|nr:DNA helicase II [Alphaproteobacteria bacterium]